MTSPIHPSPIRDTVSAHRRHQEEPTPAALSPSAYAAMVIMALKLYVMNHATDPRAAGIRRLASAPPITTVSQRFTDLTTPSANSSTLRSSASTNLAGSIKSTPPGGGSNSSGEGSERRRVLPVAEVFNTLFVPKLMSPKKNGQIVMKKTSVLERVPCICLVGRTGPGKAGSQDPGWESNLTASTTSKVIQ